MSPEIERRIDSVGRNDIDEAESIMRSLVYELGYCPSSTAHYLYLLQDDSSQLRARTAGMNIHPAPGVPEVR